jgi:hypothetical protein
MNWSRQCQIISQKIKARTYIVDLSSHFFVIGAQLCLSVISEEIGLLEHIFIPF